MTAPIAFIDTSVLCEILRVPMMFSDHERYLAEFQERRATGQRFVLPVATIIETGNHISQVNGDRYAAAQRFEDVVRLALSGGGPFVTLELEWDNAFMTKVLEDNITGQRFVDLAAAGTFGTGDLSILVQRDRFVQRSSFARNQVEIWTAEATMGAYA